MNVTVNSTNYGCFGLGGVNKLRIALESQDQLRSAVKPELTPIKKDETHAEELKSENCTEQT